jgi:hypothetical protein
VKAKPTQQSAKQFRQSATSAISDLGPDRFASLPLIWTILPQAESAGLTRAAPEKDHAGSAFPADLEA